MCFVSLFSCMPWSMQMPALGGGGEAIGLQVSYPSSPEKSGILLPLTLKALLS